MRIPDRALNIGNTAILLNGTEWPVLELTVIPGPYSNEERLGFNWTLDSFAPGLAKI
jgi:hypothetical protein